MKRVMRFCFLVCAVACVNHSAVLCMAQEPNQHPDDLVANDEAQAEKMIQGIRNLVLPQQKRLARELIHKYPNTYLARLAGKLLEEYARYDEVRDAEQQQERDQRAQVRAYWDARRQPPRTATGRPVTITNLTDEPALYQYKGPAMSWSRPVSLRGGDSHTYHYAIQFRRVTPSGDVRYALTPGGRYVFKTSGDVLRLFRSRQ